MALFYGNKLFKAYHLPHDTLKSPVEGSGLLSQNGRWIVSMSQSWQIRFSLLLPHFIQPRFWSLIHPSIFFVGSIPASMYACVSEPSAIIQDYKKLPYTGPRELTPSMVRSIEEEDKPSKRGKKQDKQTEGLVIKGAKGQTPKKRKTEKAAPSQPKQKKAKKPAQWLILQSSSDSDSDYVPIDHKRPSPTASGSESSDEEVSVRGDTPPRSPTPKVLVRSKAPSPPPASIPISLPTTFPVITSQPSTTIPIPTPIFVDAATTTTTGVQANVSNTGVRSSPPETPVTTKQPSPTRSTETNIVLGGEDLEFHSTYFSPYRVVTDKLDQLLSSSSAHPYSEAALKALFSSAVKDHDTSISNATKAIDASTSQSQKASLAVEASTKDCKDVTAKVEKLISEAQIFLDSLQAAAQKNGNNVTVSVDSLKRSLETELSQLGVALNLSAQNSEPKAPYCNSRAYDLKSEREVIRSSIGDVHSILLHLLDVDDSILTISIHRHLAEKLRPALDILSRIKGVSDTAVLPKQGGEKNSQGGAPSKPDPKYKPFEQELREKMDRLEKEMKEKELLDKKKLMFPEWTIESLQREFIEELSTHWIELVLSFSLENSKDAQFDMPINRKAFIFHCFASTAVVPSPDPKVDRDLLEFYLEFAQPQYLTWSLKKITMVREYHPIIDNIKRILVCYIHEVAKMDQEIAAASHKRTTVKAIVSADASCHYSSVVQSREASQGHITEVKASPQLTQRGRLLGL
uniref:Uncharacterized protein n=1 Tax=Lactuca sativa TaxID=4236 RepID=A0A9R1VFN4_LACSA|nr:hypothetical protein LSAT_V11C500231530 [Lactuca sativa]